MTNEERYPFTTLLEAGEFEQAAREHGKLNAAMQKAMEEHRRRSQLVTIQGTMKEREETEVEGQELRRQFEYMNDAYEHQRKEAAIRALDDASATLFAHKQNVAECDQALLVALEAAWQALSGRMAAEKEYNRARQLLSGFGAKYPEYGRSISPGRGVAVSWGVPLRVADHELMPAAWRMYCERFARVRTTELSKFNTTMV